MIKLFPFHADYTLVFGKKGSGKTSLLAGIAYKIHKKDPSHIVYCTEKDICFTYYLPYDLIGHVWLVPNSTLLIDEIATLFNSRDFKTTPKQVRDYFRYTRHNLVRVISFSQQFNDCDLQIRSMADKLYICKRISSGFSYYRRIEKDTALVTNQDGRGEIVESFVKSPLIRSGSFFFCSLRRYRKYFDSYSRLPIPDIDMCQLDYTDYIIPSLPDLGDENAPKVRNLWSHLGAKIKSFTFKKK